jgi:cob(I)alamin adenosyltransferase
MKIYTKTGDSGTTGLRGGHRVSKDDPRPEAYGTLDELNVELGALIPLLPPQDTLASELAEIQKTLFLLGARLASLPGSPELAAMDSIPAEACEGMEAAIDRMMADVPPMKGFTVPGGHASALQAHRARTICRRAERRLVALADQDVEDEGCHHLQDEMAYLNRLADYLYAVTRYCNHVNGVEEQLWKR